MELDSRLTMVLIFQFDFKNKINIPPQRRPTRMRCARDKRIKPISICRIRCFHANECVTQTRDTDDTNLFGVFLLLLAISRVARVRHVQNLRHRPGSIIALRMIRKSVKCVSELLGRCCRRHPTRQTSCHCALFQLLSSPHL